MKKDIGDIFKDAFSLFKSNQPLILGGSTAFFTVYAIAPITIILINILSLYFKRERISDQLFSKLTATFGESSALEIQNIAENFRGLASSTWITVLGSIFFIFVATTLFHVVRMSINRIWKIQVDPKNNLRYNLRHRATSFIILLMGGVLFLTTLVIDGILTFLNDQLDKLIPSIDAMFVILLGKVFSIALVTIWFSLLFKYLPDGKLNFKPALVSGLLTGILFTMGKYILGKVLVGGNLDNIFGTSASLALLFLFIFYTSMIMYFGSSFAYSYAKFRDHKIIPNKYASKYEIRLLDET